MALAFLLGPAGTPVLLSSSPAAQAAAVVTPAPGAPEPVALGGVGDRGPAVDAQVRPRRLSSDAGGNVYILDSFRIRRVDAVTGMVTTVAGSAYPGEPVHGGSALNGVFDARGNFSEDLAVTPDGTVHFLARAGLWRVETGVLRLVSPTDASSVAAGPDGSIYVHQWTYSDRGIREDDGIWILRPGATSLSRFTATARGVIRVGPGGEVFDAVGGGVWRVTSTGEQQVLGGGTQPASEGARALDIAVSLETFDVMPTGELLFAASPQSCAVWRVLSDQSLRRIAQECTSELGTAGNDVLVGGFSTIRRFAADGTEATSSGRPYAGGLKESPDGTSAVNAFGRVEHLQRDDAGRLLFSTGHRIRGTDDRGRLVTWYTPPQDVAWLSAFTRASDDSLYVAERLVDEPDRQTRTRVRRLLPSGGSAIVAGGGTASSLTSDGASAQEVHLRVVHALAVDAAGVVFVLDAEEHADQQAHLYAVVADGTWRRVAGFGTDPLDSSRPVQTMRLGTKALSIDATTGTLLFADNGAGVWRMDADGQAFQNLSRYPGTYAARLPDGSLLLSAAPQIVRIFPDGRHLVLAGAPYSASGRYLWDDGTAPLDVRLADGPAELLPDADGGVTFRQLAARDFSGVPDMVRRLSPQPLPAFRSPAALTTTTMFPEDGTASIKVTGSVPSNGDELLVTWREGTVGAPTVGFGFSLVDGASRWAVPGPPPSSTVSALTGTAYSFTVFRRTPAGATSAGVTTTVTVAGVVGRIDALWQDKGGSAGFLGGPTSQVYAVRGGWARDHTGGRIYLPVNGAAHEVHGALLQHYLALGGPNSVLGLPVTDELPSTDGHGRYNEFQGGSLYWTPTTGAREVRGAIRQAWLERLGVIGFLRYPVTDELATPDGRGRFNHFEGGSVYWTPTTGAWSVGGAIRETWSRLGWERGALGYPVTRELVTPDGRGRFNHFEGGSVYWTPTTGAQEVRGAIRATWSRLGWERGALGYPVTNELPTPDSRGRFNHFQGGSVYWTPTTGAQEVRGAIRQYWSSVGWERSALGYPVTDEYNVVGGRGQDFEFGRVRWDARTGQITTAPR